jgi:crossover junction endodeoxyribonuclease RuvC
LKFKKRQKILALDPGVVATGYSIVKENKCFEYGVIKPNAHADLTTRIGQIITEIRKLIRTYRPDICVIETLFFRKVSARSIITSAQLRGAILYLLFLEKIPLAEITPARIKKVVTGNGRASKKQIEFMIHHLYNFKEKINHHASDALAIAYTYLVTNKNYQVKTSSY